MQIYQFSGAFRGVRAVYWERLQFCPPAIPISIASNCEISSAILIPLTIMKLRPRPLCHRWMIQIKHTIGIQEQNVLLIR